MTDTITVIEQVTDTVEVVERGQKGEPGDVSTGQLNSAIAAIRQQVITVAAADSHRNATADFVCTGTGDHETIQDAIEAADSDVEVRLLDGAFNPEGSVVLPDGSNVRIRGAGAAFTRIEGNPGEGEPFFDLSLAAGQRLEHFEVDGFTLDARDVPDPTTQDPTRGLIRDSGDGDMGRLVLGDDLIFLGGEQRNMSALSLANDDGELDEVRIGSVYISLDGNRCYGLQIRKKATRLWITQPYVALTGLSGVAPYNPIAIYAGSSDFQCIGAVVKNPFAGAHSSIACSPSHNGTISGCLVDGPPAGTNEGGIEVQGKLGHGEDGESSYELAVTGNVIRDAYNGILVNNVDEPSEVPTAVQIGPNVLIDCINRDVKVTAGQNIQLHPQLHYQSGTPGGSFQEVEVDAAVSLSKLDSYASRHAFRGGTAPSAPVSDAVVAAAGGLYLANAKALNLGNAAGTSFQAIIQRLANNAIQIAGGSGLPEFTLDTNGRIGVGKNLTSPSTVSRAGQSSNALGAIAFHNATSGEATTKITKAGHTQGTVPLDEWIDYTTGAVLAQIRADGLLQGVKGVATFVKAGVPSDADWTVAPPDGTLVIDTSNSRLYSRVGGTWKYTALA
jgi:hypothetical protein